MEIDVQVAGDGTLVAFHDELLTPKTDCTGSTAEKTWEELKRCRYRHHVAKPTRDGLLTLDEAIAVGRHVKPSAHFYLDLKTFTTRVAGLTIQGAYVRGLRSVIDRIPNERLWLVSGSEPVLISLKAAFGADAHVLADAENGASGVRMVERLVLEGMVVSHKKVAQAHVDAIHRQGGVVVLFGVKSYGAAKEALAFEPEAVQTDDIPALQAAMR